MVLDFKEQKELETLKFEHNKTLKELDWEHTQKEHELKCIRLAVMLDMAKAELEIAKAGGKAQNEY